MSNKGIMAREQISLVSVVEGDGFDPKGPQLDYQCREYTEVSTEYEPSCLQQCSNKMIQVLEDTFYK